MLKTLLIILKKSLLQKKKKENMLQLNFMWQHLSLPQGRSVTLLTTDELLATI